MMGLNVSTSRGRYSVAQFGCAIRSMFTLQKYMYFATLHVRLFIAIPYMRIEVLASQWHAMQRCSC